MHVIQREHVPNVLTHNRVKINFEPFFIGEQQSNLNLNRLLSAVISRL